MEPLDVENLCLCRFALLRFLDIALLRFAFLCIVLLLSMLLRRPGMRCLLLLTMLWYRFACFAFFRCALLRFAWLGLALSRCDSHRFAELDVTCSMTVSKGTFVLQRSLGIPWGPLRMAHFSIMEEGEVSNLPQDACDGLMGKGVYGSGIGSGIGSGENFPQWKKWHVMAKFLYILRFARVKVAWEQNVRGGVRQTKQETPHIQWVSLCAIVAFELIAAPEKIQDKRSTMSTRGILLSLKFRWTLLKIDLSQF